MTELLEIQNLQKNYRGIHAIKDISFKMKEASVVGIVGGNGAGKSTLMKCITGAERQDNGIVIFEGKELTVGNPTHSRQSGIEMIYQDLNLCAQQTVLANIFLGRETQKSGLPILDYESMKNKASEILKALNSDINPTAIVEKLSGGQQQAVAIARAMTFNPKLIIMDEPTAALGVKEVKKVLSLVENLKKQRVAVIIISHRLVDLFETADRIIFMKHGKIEKDKSVSDISLKQLTELLVS